jgi:alkylation response protein AidB-like acyl-CoA dehydrogenase
MIDLSFTDEQLALRAAAADVFGRENAIARARQAEPHGFDEELWHTVFGAGFVTMAVSEGRGGSSASAPYLVIVAEEYGRALAPVPLIEAVVANELIEQAPAGSGLLESVVAGDVLATLVLTELGPSPHLIVPAGAVADVAVGLRGDQLIAIRRPAEPGAAATVENLGGLPVASWDISAADEEVLCSGPLAAELFGDAVTEWKLLTAAALNGLRERSLQIGVDYVKQRHAFGVPLGWFQAVQHRLADDTAAGDGSRLLVHEAAWARFRQRPEAAALAQMAFLHGAETAFRTCRTCLQFHGGYGFTLEYDIQLFFRRAKAWPLVAGPVRDSYQDLAVSLFGAPSAD